MAPTAGGQYHWVSEFAPRQYQKVLSYISGTYWHCIIWGNADSHLGWLSAVSWQSIIAIDSYIVGVIIQGIIVVNDPTYVPTRWQGTLLIIASVIGIGLFNVFAAKHLPLAEGIFVTFHVFAFFPTIIVLLVLSPKQSAHDVFLNFTDNGAGWPNVGWATLVGQVSTMFVVLGSDSVAHMAEEIEDAGIIVPKSMVWTFLLNVPFTFGLLLTYLFCIGDVTQAIASPTGFPFIYVFQNATGTVGGTTGMTIVILLLLIMITISSMASTSRQTFAFARDNGLPFSKWLGHVSQPPSPLSSLHVSYILTRSPRSTIPGTSP
jgi:amino acid transporter